MNISPIESRILLSINIDHISSGKMFLAQGPPAKKNLSPFLDNFHPAFLICATSPRSTALQVRKWVWNKRSTGSTVDCVSDLGDKTWCGCGWAVRAAASLGLQPGNCTKPRVRDPHHFFFFTLTDVPVMLERSYRGDKKCQAGITAVSVVSIVLLQTENRWVP